MKILKINDDQRIVYGWANVITKGDESVVDLEGDVIQADELEKATTTFMLKSREGHSDHKGVKTANVVHSFPMIKSIADSLGITLAQEGWIIGLRVDDDQTWAKVKAGEYDSFSIGGNAKRVPADA